jgi:hypothetical protein
MRIHIYNYDNSKKLTAFDESHLSSLRISHTINELSSCTMTFPMDAEPEIISVQGFENVYIEDERGNIIFGGLIVKSTANPSGSSISCYDHRWLLTKLILDEGFDLSEDDDILEAINYLIALGQIKRRIPIEFDMDKSALNPDYKTSLRFETGDTIGSCLRKIIEPILARWAVRYEKVGDYIIGKLIVRSIVGVTPEGVGIARIKEKSEDGEIVPLIYEEGQGNNNVQSFSFDSDMSNYNSRTKIGYKIDGESVYYTAPPTGSSPALETVFGICEKYATDYSAASEEGARRSSIVNQTYITSGVDIILSPDFTRFLNCGDRVVIKIKSQTLLGAEDGISARIDKIDYIWSDGLLSRTLGFDIMNQLKFSGSNDVVREMNELSSKQSNSDQYYFNH